jgi:hypothetical protein
MIETKQYEEAVKGHGALEGEVPAVAYFYDLALNGQGDNIQYPDGSITTFFGVNGDEHEAFGIILPFFTIYQNSDGLIYGEEVGTNTIAKMKTQAQEEWAVVEEEDNSQD